jgi:hypothetical protein
MIDVQMRAMSPTPKPEAASAGNAYGFAPSRPHEVAAKRT